MRAKMIYDFFLGPGIVYLQFYDHYHSEDFVNALRHVMQDPLYHKDLTAIIDLTNKKGSYLGFNIQMVVDFVKSTENLPKNSILISNNPVLTAFGYLTKKRVQKIMNFEIYSSFSSVQKHLCSENIIITEEDLRSMKNSIYLKN